MNKRRQYSKSYLTGEKVAVSLGKIVFLHINQFQFLRSLLPSLYFQTFSLLLNGIVLVEHLKFKM